MRRWVASLPGSGTAGREPGDGPAGEASSAERLRLLGEDEYRVFMVLREGFSLRECARRLHLRYLSAWSIARRVRRKLCVGSVPELIRRYRDIP